MGENRSLDDFLDSGDEAGDERGEDAADERSEDATEPDSDVDGLGGTGDTDGSDDSDGVDSAETDGEDGEDGEAGTDEEAGTIGVNVTAPADPPRATYRWSPDGDDCPSCGRTVERRWRDGDRLVCVDCKEW